jgi:hypothetical protein
VSDEQLSLEAKEEGMALALTRHGIEDWKDAAREAVIEMPIGHTFTADDLIAVVGLPSGDAGQNENNAVGAIINGMAKQKLIAKTASRVNATRKGSHARELTVWRRTQPGTGRAGAQDQPARRSPQADDLEARVAAADIVLAGLATEAYEAGDMAGFQRGYEQGCDAASKRPGAILEAKHDGVLAGRKQQAARTMALITEMRQAMKGKGPVEVHSTTCWQRHPMCALDSIRKAQEIK